MRPNKTLRTSWPLAVLVAVVAAFGLSDCKREQSPYCNGNNSTEKNKILLLGASRVEGDAPTYVSYRKFLWNQLMDGGWTFDFVGNRRDSFEYNLYQDRCEFDVHHEGHSGFTSGQILKALPHWLDRTSVPDIVLFSSPGGNDALDLLPYDQALDNINAIIDTLQARNPNVTIVIEKMAPPNTWLLVPPLSTYYNDIHEDVELIAQNESTSTSKIVAVDMATGFTNSMLADPIHYNALGAEHVATRYYQVLVNLLEP